MYKQKLIDLLKSDEKVKTEIENPIFGCRIYDNSCNLGGVIIRESEYGEPGIYRDDGVETYIKLHKEYSSIIGLPLSERFIRMYCENKNIVLSFKNDFIEIEYQISGFLGENLEYSYINLDNTKDFDNQDDFVYQKIYEALSQLKP